MARASQSWHCLWIGFLFGLAFCCFAQTPNITEKLPDIAPSASSVPLHDNRFVVDKDIQSLQILFSTNDIQNFQVLGPAGLVILPLQNNPGVSWQQIDKLYSITLTKPALGQWEIKGKMLGTPKVLIESTLKMITTDFPNNLFRGETLGLSAYLEDKGVEVTSPEILSNIQFIATLHNVATLDKYKIFLLDDEKKPTGKYRYNYDLQSLPGVYRVTFQVLGLLFQRERVQQFYLYDYPATFTTKVIADTDELLIEAKLESQLIEESSCLFTALFSGKDHELSSAPLIKKEDKSWQLIIPISDATHSMALLLNGKTKDKRMFNITFPEVDVYSMYQKNLQDLQAHWDANLDAFWKNSADRQLGVLLPLSQEKLREQYLFVVNKSLEKDAIPLREYITFQQTLLKVWKPIVFGEKAIEPTAKKVEATPAQTPAAAKSVIHKTDVKQQERIPKRWRYLIIGALILCMLFVFLLIGGMLWLYQEAKMRALFIGIGTQLGKIQSLIKRKKGKADKQEKSAAESTDEAKEEVKEEVKEEAKEEVKADEKPAEPAAEAKPEVKAEEKPAAEAKPEEKVEEKPAAEAKPEVKAEEKPAEEVKPEVKAEEKPAEEVKPEAKTEPTADQPLPPETPTQTPTQGVQDQDPR